MWNEWAASVLLVAGGLFCLIAGIGVVRLNDVFARMHAATKAGTLGLALVCVAVMLLARTWTEVAEALVVFVFMIASAPIGAHVIGRAAFRTRTPVDPRTQFDPGSEAFRRRPAERRAAPAKSAPHAEGG
jgi:multicomponent Na+:H+ antiporter subunit G